VRTLSPRAAVATAHLIAKVVYRMLKDKIEYEPMSVAQYEQHYREQQLKYLQKKAVKLGFQLTLSSCF
jgi:transposase